MPNSLDWWRFYSQGRSVVMGSAAVRAFVVEREVAGSGEE